jgi:hypothetical protein
MAKAVAMSNKSNQLAALRGSLQKKAALDKQGKRHSKIEQRDALKERALTTFGHASLWDSMDECRKPADQRFDRDRCGTIYCIPCYNRAINNQRKRIAAVFQRHSTEADQRQHLRSVTLLFDAYGFDLWAKPYPVFPYDRTLKGIEYARGELKKLKRKFPNLVMVGAFELEPMDNQARSLRLNRKATDALLDDGVIRDTAVGIKRISVPARMTMWQDHVLVLHAHILMELKGTDINAFDTYCRQRLGNDRKMNKVPRGVVINPLRPHMTIEESITGISKYPYKTFFHYDHPKSLKGIVSPAMYEDEVLAAMIVGHKLLGTKRTLINIGM